MKHTKKPITPQQVYGTVDATCRECGFCVNINDSGWIGDDAFYCTRFRPQHDQKARINAYDQACGKFEGKDGA